MTTSILIEWIATLPPFKGADPQLRILPGAGALYPVQWNGNKAVLNLFRDEGATIPGERAKDKLGSEVAGLRIYAPLELAPQLIWEGNLPGEIGGYAVIHEWVDGASLCNTAPADSETELYAGALWAVHSQKVELKMLSPNPRNLEVWWTRVHEKYRDLQTDIQQSLPQSVSTELGRLVQSVAADAQTHKRFWQGASLVPVHGSPTCDNVIIRGEGATFVNWQRFGLGDCAYEVALAASQYWGGEIGQRIVSSYLERAKDPMLSTRIQLYTRLLPFGSVIALLDDRNLRSELWGMDFLQNLKACIETYSRSQSTPMSIYHDAEGWVSSLYSHSSPQPE